MELNYTDNMVIWLYVIYFIYKGYFFSPKLDLIMIHFFLIFTMKINFT